MPLPQPLSRHDVITACARNGPRSNGFAYNNQIFIKYGTEVTMAEAAMQTFVHENADHDIVYTPRVYDAFTKPLRGAPDMTYIVMERMNNEPCVTYLKARPDETATVLEDVAKAVRHIWSLPLPPDSSIGPIGNQIPADRFFSDYGAGRTFENVSELETWINAKLAEANKDIRIDLGSPELKVCHLDLTQYNILVGKPVVIIDWGYSGIYPIEFEEFALVNQFNRTGMKFARGLHKELFGPKLSKQMRPLSIAACVLAYGD